MALGGEGFRTYIDSALDTWGSPPWSFPVLSWHRATGRKRFSRGGWRLAGGNSFTNRCVKIALCDIAAGVPIGLCNSMTCGVRSLPGCRYATNCRPVSQEKKICVESNRPRRRVTKRGDGEPRRGRGEERRSMVPY